MFVFRWFLVQLHMGTRREALHDLFDKEHRIGQCWEQGDGDTNRSGETTGSDDHKRSNQCHYVCIKLKVNNGKAEVAHWIG